MILDLYFILSKKSQITVLKICAIYMSWQSLRQAKSTDSIWFVIGNGVHDQLVFHKTHIIASIIVFTRPFSIQRAPKL
jgi:predicted ABC-type exoprotein transport system permease subunit